MKLWQKMEIGHLPMEIKKIEP